MQADNRLPVEKQRNYKGVFDAFRSIVHEDGIFGLWRGVGPTVVRAMVLNLGKL